MSVLKVTTVTDLAGLGGFTLSSGSITANGTLKVSNININGNITGSSSYNIPSMSGQSGRFLSTDGTNLTWSTDISGGGGGGGAGAGFRSMQVFTSNGTWTKPSGEEVSPGMDWVMSENMSSELEGWSAEQVGFLTES